MKRRLLVIMVLVLIAFSLAGCPFRSDDKPSIPTYNLTMQEPVGAGTVSPDVGTHKYNKDTLVDLQATPAGNWHFSHWSGEVADSSSASTTIQMNKNQTVQAVFVEQDPNVEYGITVSVVDSNNLGLEGVELSFVGDEIDDFTKETGADGTVQLAQLTTREKRSSRAEDRGIVGLNLQLKGQVTITPSKTDWEFVPPSKTVTALDAGETVTFTGTSLIVDPTYEISGFVEDPNGQGIGEAEVLITGDDLDPAEIGEVNSAVDGSWGPVEVKGNVTVTAEKEHWTFTEVEVSEAVDDIVITGKIFKGAVHEPQIEPGSIPAGSSENVRFTVFVNIHPQYLADFPAADETSVALYRKDGTDWELIGYMFDDGDLNHGDEIKGDRIYSNIFTFNEPEETNLNLKVAVTTKEGYVLEVFSVLNVVYTTGDTVKEITDTHGYAEDELNKILQADPDLSAAESLQQLSGILEAQGNILSTTQENNLLEINYESQTTSFILLAEESDEGGLSRGRSVERSSQRTVPTTQQTTGRNMSFVFQNIDEDTEFIGSRSIMIWAPFASEFSPWDETEGIQERFDDSDLGFTYGVYTDFAADVASLKDIINYGMIVLATHGSGGRWLATGEIVYDDNKYEIELSQGRMAIWQNMKIVETGGVESKEPVYAVNDDWFTNNVYGNFNNAVIVNNSCESTRTDRLWDAFSAKGAGTYFGYDRIVSSRFAVEQVYELVEAMREWQTTTGDAYQSKSDPYHSSNATWEIRGNENLIFPAGLINGSFEEGLMGWHKDGDGRAITALSFLEPTHENGMAIISSGLGYTVRHGSIEQRFLVDEDTEMLRFDWNYISEEFLEWIGSAYQDPFRVSIEGPDGYNEILYLTVDGIANQFGASYCDSAYNPPEQCILYGNSGDLIPVSPTIVFDQGDVWMTGWQSFEFDISDYQGQVVTLKFEAEDEGDTIYDTAVLLDNVRIESADEIVDEYNLSVHQVGPGLVYPIPGTHRYPSGSSAYIEAEADPGFEFLQWHGPAAEPEENETVVYMDGHRTVTALFVEELDAKPQVFNEDFSWGYTYLDIPYYGPQDDTFAIFFPRDDTGAVHTVDAFMTMQGLASSSQAEPLSTVKAELKHEFQYSLRKMEQEILGRHDAVGSISAQIAFEPQELEVGDTRNFKVIVGVSGDQYIIEEKEATLRAVGNTGRIWVVEDDLNLSASDVDWYIDEYDTRIQYIVTSYFGTEPNKNTFPILEPDPDFEPKTNILFAELASDFGGYFWAIDLYSSSEYVNSNEAKVLYINPDAYGSKERVAGTIAYELQHMIFFNEKVLSGRSGAIDDIWINEGFSCLASDLVGYGFQQNLGYEYQVSQFLDNPAQTSLVNWESTSADYGAVYLFARYIFDQAGQDVLNAVSRSAQNPKTSIADVFETDFHLVFADWAVTLVVNDRLGVNPRYTYPSITINSGDINKQYLEINESLYSTPVKGWGIAYMHIGPGNNQDLYMAAEAGTGGNFWMTVARWRD